MGSRFSELFEVSGLVVFALLAGIVLPSYLGFAGKGFEEGFTGKIMSNFVFYYGIFFAGLIGVVVLKVREFWLGKRRDDNWFGHGVVHDPDEDGLLGLFGLGGWFSVRRAVFLALLVFIPVGVIGVLSNTFFVSAPPAEMQVSEGVQVYFSAEPAAISEELLFLFLYCLHYGLLRRLFRGVDKAVFFMVLVLFLVPLMGGEWALFHFLRYGNAELSLLSTFIFGSVGTLLTVLTGSFIPRYVWHFVNNAAVQVNLFLWSDESVVLWAGLLWFLLLFVFAGWEYWLVGARRRREAYG